jgi:hypothetical protein
VANVTKTPGKAALAFTGNHHEFWNSGDARLILTGSGAPTLAYLNKDVDPGTGSVTLAGAGAPTRPVGLLLTGQAVTIAETHASDPGTGTLTLTGKQADREVPFVSSDAKRLVGPTTLISLTGQSITVKRDHTSFPTVGSLTITEKQGDRELSVTLPPIEKLVGPTTLISLTGQSITVKRDQTSFPTVGSLTLTGKQADRESQSVSSDAKRLVGPTTLVSLTGQAVTIQHGDHLVLPSVGSAALSGQAATVSRSIIQLPSLEEAQGLAMTGRGMTVTLSGTLARVGTMIENTDATEDTKNRYNICDVSGFKAKPGELVERWDGMWVLPEFNEPRNQQDYARSRAERQRGAKRPEPVGSETMISDQYPNGVTTDDL